MTGQVSRLDGLGVNAGQARCQGVTGDASRLDMPASRLDRPGVKA